MAHAAPATSASPGCVGSHSLTRLLWYTFMLTQRSPVRIWETAAQRRALLSTAPALCRVLVRLTDGTLVYSAGVLFLCSPLCASIPWPGAEATRCVFPTADDDGT